MDIRTVLFDSVKYNIRLVKVFKMLDLFIEYEGKALNFRILPQILEINKKTFYRQLQFLKRINAITVEETVKRNLKVVKTNGVIDFLKKNRSIFENWQSGNTNTDLSNSPTNHSQSPSLMKITLQEIAENNMANINQNKVEGNEFETEFLKFENKKDEVNQFETNSQIEKTENETKGSSMEGQMNAKIVVKIGIYIQSEGGAPPITLWEETKEFENWSNGEAEKNENCSYIYNNILYNIPERKESKKDVYVLHNLDSLQNVNVQEDVIKEKNVNVDVLQEVNVLHNVDVKEEVIKEKKEKENKKEKERKERNKKEVEVELPDWLPLDLWEEYLNMRRQIKKPLTSFGQRLAIKNLNKLREQGYDINEIIETSISRCWLGFFPPQNNLFHNYSGYKNRKEEDEEEDWYRRVSKSWREQYYKDLEPLYQELKEKERKILNGEMEGGIPVFGGDEDD